MQFGKVRRENGSVDVVLVERGSVFALDMARNPAVRTLADLLHSPDPLATASGLLGATTSEKAETQRFVAPVDQQEIWAAGVTYKRSKVAREEESKGAAQFYDKVYTAPRPEIFFKATPNRVSGPGQPLRIRRDTTWTVPEPELALCLTPEMKLAGFTVGNDMSARDIEGENPLYLPQAKVYRECCGLGPCILLADKPLDREATKIRLTIERGRQKVFQGETNVGQMARTFDDLIGWLGRDNVFPNGAILLTGTGVVPPDDFSLAPGDLVSIEIVGIGTLTNPIVQG
jgi:2-dehydro-3-deoxy-D-arabinonate dehydratase